MARPGHISLCPDDCRLRHNSTLLALAKCGDNKYFDDCGLLKTALYTKLKEGWNPHTAIDDLNPEFCYPLIHWACALGKAEALQWLLKMKLKPSMQCQKTGEYPLHYAVKMLYCIRRVDHMPVDRICNRFNLILNVVTDHEPHVLLLRDLKGNSVFHTCALKIVQQEGISAELDFYENCLKLLTNCLQRNSDLEVWNKTAETSNCQSIFSTAFNSQNNEGNTVLHILAQNDISYKSLSYLVETFSDDIKKNLKNNNNLTAAEVAVRSGAKRVAAYLGISPENRTDNLHIKLPSVFQLYTQDVGDPTEFQEGQDNGNLNGFVHNTETTQVICSKDHSVNGKDSHSKEKNLRLTIRVQREGFYCVGNSEDVISCDSDNSVDAGTQQDPDSSPSLLSCASYSFPETQNSAESAKTEHKSDELFTDSHESQTENGGLCLDALSSQCESDITEDELMSFEEEVKIVAAVPSSSACGGIITMTATNHSMHDIQRKSQATNSLSSTTPNVTSEKACSGPEAASCLNGRMNEESGAPHTPARLPTTPSCNDRNQRPDIKPALNVLNGQETSTSTSSALQLDGGMDSSEFSSPLVRFIKEEFDVASLVRAKLMDRKERSRSELCDIEQNFRHHEQKENEENNQLQQMQTELEALKVAQQRNGECKKKLVEELEVIEEETVAMEMRCGELEHLIAEHTQRKEDLLKDKQNLDRQRAVIKRKVEEYDNALMEIAPAVESSKRPKQEPLG